MSTLLTEKHNALLESEKYTELSPNQTSDMATMLEMTKVENEKLLNEGTISADIAQFTPILLPMVRRVYPNLIANEVLGVQPMTMPTGYIYALTNDYRGNDEDLKIRGKAQILVCTGDKPDAGDESLTGATSAGTGKVIYVEDIDDTKFQVLVALSTDTAFAVEDVTNDNGTMAVEAVYTNEASFGNILKNYTGTHTTAQAELLAKDMKEVGFTVSKKSIEAKSRALKGQYTIEMYQDLKSQHGLLADEQIMSLMSYELQAEIDREIVDFVNANSTPVPDTSNIGFSTTIFDGTGQWEIERYRREAIKISKESKKIMLDTKRGQGNVLLVSPQVVTMLEQLGNFKAAPVASTLNAPITNGVIGTFDNKYKVVVDQYAKGDYATVLYKGQSNQDAMGFFAPYVPLSFQKTTHADSGQPAVIAKTRYALSTIPGMSTSESNDRAKTYSRTFGIDFTNTALA